MRPDSDRNPSMYSVHILKEGYSKPIQENQQKACGTVSLVKGPLKIIVDTGNPWDKDLIIQGKKISLLYFKHFKIDIARI